MSDENVSEGSEPTQIPLSASILDDNIEQMMGGLPYEEPSQGQKSTNPLDPESPEKGEGADEERKEGDGLEGQPEEGQADQTAAGPDSGQSNEVVQIGELSVPLQAEFEHNGRKFTVKELLADYAGQDEIKRRFSEFDRDKKAWETEVKEKFQTDSFLVGSRLKKLQKLVEEGKDFEAMGLMANFAGKDSVEYQKGLVNQAKAIAERFSQMSEEQEEAYWAKQEAKSVKEKLEERDEQEKTKKQKNDSNAKLAQVLRAEGVSQAQFKEAFEFLKTSGELKEIKDLPAEEKVRRIARYYKDAAKENRVVEAIDKLAPDHPNKDELVDILFKVAEDSHSVQDIIDVGRKYFGLAAKTSEENSSTESGKPELDGPKRTASKEEKTESPGEYEVDPLASWDQP